MSYQSPWNWWELPSQWTRMERQKTSLCNRAQQQVLRAKNSWTAVVCCWSVNRRGKFCSWSLVLVQLQHVFFRSSAAFSRSWPLACQSRWSRNFQNCFMNCQMRNSWHCFKQNVIDLLVHLLFHKENLTSLKVLVTMQLCWTLRPGDLSCILLMQNCKIAGNKGEPCSTTFIACLLSGLHVSCSQEPVPATKWVMMSRLGRFLMNWAAHPCAQMYASSKDQGVEILVTNPGKSSSASFHVWSLMISFLETRHPCHGCALQKRVPHAGLILRNLKFWYHSWRMKVLQVIRNCVRLFVTKQQICRNRDFGNCGVEHDPDGCVGGSACARTPVLTCG